MLCANLGCNNQVSQLSTLCDSCESSLSVKIVDDSEIKEDDPSNDIIIRIVENGYLIIADKPNYSYRGRRGIDSRKYWVAMTKDSEELVKSLEAAYAWKGENK